MDFQLGCIALLHPACQGGMPVGLPMSACGAAAVLLGQAALAMCRLKLTFGAPAEAGPVLLHKAGQEHCLQPSQAHQQTRAAQRL